ncbi:MAG: YbhB/YbcL family Raf kinase inhibitor-like protein, partial [Aquificaceae bacterium]|nr:YbhB/YbcL family Raf kinase inhibitor-like protein [Aquificaceae bacterium]
MAEGLVQVVQPVAQVVVALAVVQAVVPGGSGAGGGTGGGGGAFVLQSSAFSNNGNIPRDHTCDGADTSPPLSWSNAPQGTQSFVVIMEDPDAQQVAGRVWTHWVIYDIPANRNSLPQGFPKQASVDGIKQG